MKYYMFVIVLALILLEEVAFASQRVKRDYTSHYYDLGGSAITQTFRAAREVSSTEDEGTHTCSIWGRGAIRTYTDEFYHFTSTCKFILSRHCADVMEDFNVEIRHGSGSYLEHFFVKMEGARIVVENGIIHVNDKVVSLPYDDKAINIQQYGIQVRFRNRKHTISVFWNYNDALSVSVDAQYKGSLCGLCGPFDASASTTYDLNYIQANQLDILNKDCSTTFSENTACASAQICSNITELFGVCSSEKINNEFIVMCQRDACACNKIENCHCASFNKAAQQCVYVDQLQWKSWRNTVQCAQPTCPGNQIYQDCGPAFLATCTEPNSQQQSDQCVNTCICPKGTVLNNAGSDKTCISQINCPCEYDGKIYNSGETMNSFCRSCDCQSGIWNCTNFDCPGICKIEEGTHITTFDGAYYNLIGDCLYYAIVTKDWSVKIEMHLCQSAYHQRCLQKVTYVKHQNSYSINNEGVVKFNGNAMVMPLQHGEIMIFQQSSQYIQVFTKSGFSMQILVSPIMQLYMSLPKSAQGTTKGLCGTYNGNANDDFLSAQGAPEPTYVSFSESWTTSENCDPPKLNPHCVSSEKERYAKEQCAYIKDTSGAFAKCHSTVDFNKYYEMCNAASCHCENIDGCVCAALEAYAHACAAKGIIVMNWRRSICSITCPSSQVYHYDMRACNRTCQLLSKPDFTCELQDIPVTGCGCAEGLYMNHKATCVKISECPCYVNDLIIEAGSLIVHNGMNCFCINGVPSCPDGTLSNSKGCEEKQYSDCSNATLCKRTCETLNKPCPDPCKPGCVCPDGLVEDSSGRCVEPSECPCLFEGETYGPGEKIKVDCNKCTCTGGKWSCTDNVCPKTCLVYGDGHYMTFDGKRYSFDGNCEYIFVEDQCLQEKGTFQILTESVPCCENGVTCSRNIKILFEGKELISLTENGIKELPLGQSQCTDNLYTIHTVGLYLVLKFSNGITVIWDKRTRFSITLDPKWKNKVCGLCGNYNDSLEDDLTTKGNSLVTSSVEFGNSWKSMQYCSDTVNQTFPCDNNPYCLAWAQKRCNLINSAVFQACHKRVDPIPFYDACVQEACACDKEGKYLGFCTAVAVYAEACNKADVCIRWRSPDLCPVYCDYYNTPGNCSWHYQPCGTITVRTCSDHSIGKKYSAVLEGCYANCPESAPYLDENTMRCVTLPRCTCYYDGRILQPGEKTANECEECMCNEGITTCRRRTTTTVTPTTVSTTSSTTTVSSTVTTGTTSSTTGTTVSTTSSTAETTPTTSTTETTVSTTSGTTSSTTGTTVSTTSSTTETTPTTSTTGTTVSTTSGTTSSTTGTTVSTTSSTTGTTSSTTGTTVSTTGTTTETTGTTTTTGPTVSTTSGPTSSTTGTTVSTTTSTTEITGTTTTTGPTVSTTSGSTPTPTGTTVSTTSSTTGTTPTTSTSTGPTVSTTSGPTSSTPGTTVSTTTSTTGSTPTPTATTVSTTSSTTGTTPTTSTSTGPTVSTTSGPTSSTPGTTVSTTTSTTGSTPTPTGTTVSTTSSTTGTTPTTSTSTGPTVSTTSGPTSSTPGTTVSTTTSTTGSTPTPTGTTVSTTSSTTGTTPTTSTSTGPTVSTTSGPTSSTPGTTVSTTTSTTGSTPTPTGTTVSTTSSTTGTTPTTSTSTGPTVSTTSGPTSSTPGTTVSTTTSTTGSTPTPTGTTVSTTSSTTGTTPTTSTSTGPTVSTTSGPTSSTPGTTVSTTTSTTGSTPTPTGTTVSTTSSTTGKENHFSKHHKLFGECVDTCTTFPLSCEASILLL
ncbi:mucin-19-like [Mobula hypostoma]|uniref:mucin-19-like n=1 Tax=Mobula hypostoma TaxID=723540 RepID=UPI002FC27B55